jgi:hypothetical protein
MNTAAQTFEISEITLLTFADEICMRGVIHKKNLSYDTELNINSHQLNKVINALQMQNPESDVTGSFINQSDGYGNTLYFLYGNQLENRMIELDTLTELDTVKRIRA